MGGRVVYTQGISALPEKAFVNIMQRITHFDNFTPDNDLYGEHDFGQVKYEAYKCFWKIDYYDKNYQFGSENPADPAVTKRVMTILLADEY